MNVLISNPGLFSQSDVDAAIASYIANHPAKDNQAYFFNGSGTRITLLKQVDSAVFKVVENGEACVISKTELDAAGPLYLYALAEFRATQFGGSFNPSSVFVPFYGEPQNYTYNVSAVISPVFLGNGNFVLGYIKAAPVVVTNFGIVVSCQTGSVSLSFLDAAGNELLSFGASPGHDGFGGFQNFPTLNKVKFWSQGLPCTANVFAVQADYSANKTSLSLMDGSPNLEFLVGRDTNYFVDVRFT